MPLKTACLVLGASLVVQCVLLLLLSASVASWAIILRKRRVLKTKEVGIEIRPGDVFRIESGGGGGWGDPAKRDPAARERDESNGFV